MFVREVTNTSYNRVVTLDHGNYNISTLAAHLQARLNANSHISDGVWTVTNNGLGGFSINQTSPTFVSAYFQ